jgi:hypothetical protein
MNYRSVVILGSARLVSQRQEMLDALEVISDHIVPGRWAEVRAPNELEMKQTAVLALPLQEVSAKVRVGPPEDGGGLRARSMGRRRPYPHDARQAHRGRPCRPGVEAPQLSRFTRYRR